MTIINTSDSADENSTGDQHERSDDRVLSAKEKRERPRGMVCAK